MYASVSETPPAYQNPFLCDIKHYHLVLRPTFPLPSPYAIALLGVANDNRNNKDSDNDATTINNNSNDDNNSNTCVYIYIYIHNMCIYIYRERERDVTSMTLPCWALLRPWSGSSRMWARAPSRSLPRIISI